MADSTMELLRQLMRVDDPPGSKIFGRVTRDENGNSKTVSLFIRMPDGGEKDLLIYIKCLPPK